MALIKTKQIQQKDNEKMKLKPENEQQRTETHQNGSFSTSFYKFYTKLNC